MLRSFIDFSRGTLIRCLETEMLPSEESFFTLLFAFPDGGWKSDQMCELRTFFKSVGLRIRCLVGGMEW